MLDWGLFHVEPMYNGLLQRYRQALRQRNAQLRQRVSRSSLAAWSKELEVCGVEIHRLRGKYAEEVRPPLDLLIGQLLGRDVEVRYQPGWNVEESLADKLERTLETDLARGYTGFGPHRADIRFSVDGVPAQHVLSRGEAKLFVAAVLLAQTEYVVKRAESVPIVLVDDLPSELDARNRARLMQVLQASKAQIFLTTLSEELLDTHAWTDQKMFHVEQGVVRELV